MLSYNVSTYIFGIHFSCCVPLRITEVTLQIPSKMSSDDACDASSAIDDNKEGSSSSESEMLAAVEAAKNTSTKDCKGKKAAPAVRCKKKQKGKEKAPAIQVLHACLLAYDTNELLLHVKAFMTVSCNLRQSMDKKADKF